MISTLSLSILTFVTSTAFAQNLNSASLKDPTPVELRQAVLGSSCQVLGPSKGALPCQPAWLPFLEEPTFVANLYLGENYQRVNAYKKDLENKDELAVVEKLLEETEPLQLRAGASLWAASPNFAVAVTPLHMTFYSELRNRAYPEVDLRISIEESLRLQGAYKLKTDSSVLSTGVQLRSVKRKTLFQDLVLFDVLSDPKLLKIEEHDVVFLEPGFVWMYNSDWKPRFTMLAQNIQLYQSGDRPPAELSGAYFDTGVGAAVPLSIGALDFGLNYRADQELENDWSRMNFGTTYSLGLMSTQLSLFKDGFSAGVSTHFLSVRTGVAYFQNSARNWSGQKKSNETVTLEFALVF